MKIGVIGYRNQSLKILKILLKLKYDNILVYCYKKITSEYKLNQKIIYTYDLKNLKNTDVIFITSPSKTHFKYINYFLNTKAMIFCEKPGCTKFNELYYLKNLKKSQRKKLYFNYNYIKSELFDQLKDFVRTFGDKGLKELAKIHPDRELVEIECRGCAEHKRSKPVIEVKERPEKEKIIYHNASGDGGREKGTDNKILIFGGMLLLAVAILMRK